MSAAADLIRVKRDGGRLTPDQVRAFVQGCTDGSISEGPAAAILVLAELEALAFALGAGLLAALGVGAGFTALGEAGQPGHHAGGIVGLHGGRGREWH